MCTFNPDSERCTRCVCYGGCLDEAFEIIVQLPEPRTDGPLKWIPRALLRRRCRWAVTA